MSEKVPCSRCGALILLSTAERTGGSCQPCRGGYRDSLLRAIEEREQAKNDPRRNLWVSLVRRVNQSSGFCDALSHEEKLYFAVGLLQAEVYNGGFDQYFFNSSGSHYAAAEEGLIVLGAFETLGLLHAAKEVL